MLKETLLKFFKLDGVFQHLHDYIETRIELLKYELKDELARGIARSTVIVMIAVFFTLFILLLSFSLAYLLADYVGLFGGFSIVAGVYLVFAILLLFFKDSIGHWLEAEIKKVIHKQKHNDTGNG
jgi:hypothetical protein